MRFGNKTLSLVSAALLSMGVAGCGSLGIGGDSSEEDTASTNYDAMITRFSELKAADAGDVKAAVGLSRYLRYSGRASEAGEILAPLYSEFSDEALYMTELGVVQLVLGNSAESQAALEGSKYLNADFWRTYAALGIVYDLQGLHSDATSAYYKALEYCPDSSSIRNNLGLSAGYVGDVNQAIMHIGEARALQPKSKLIRNNLAMFESIQANCPDCSADEYQNLTKMLYNLDWPAGQGEVSCADVAANARAIVQELKDNSFIDLYIHFAFDSAELLAKSEGALDQLAQAMMSNDLSMESFLLEGHTDATGSDEYNMGLSSRRAASVRAYLERSGGVSSERLESMGFGESQLLDPKHPQSGVNRRVRVSLVK
jgi:outer membrane protein OmpA-like peptidoglycan-associated protein/Flp pilus assembly protein TadD